MKLYETMFYFISGHGRGWAFSSRDLSLKFGRQEIDNTLSDLAQKGKIRRVERGIYDYPKYSDLLSKNLSPDVDQVANAYARKFNWQIEASGDSALNILGLSTQIPAKYIYLSSGSNKSYELCDGINLEFKKSALKNIGFKYKESSLIVQALNHIGKDYIDDIMIKKIQDKLNDNLCEKIIKDTATATGWIHDTIKLICQKKGLNE